jgi:hypothetical protein
MSSAAVDLLIAQGAAKHHGVFDRVEALEAGMSERMIDQRIAERRYVKLHRNVYVMAGTPIGLLTRLAGAIKWAGPGAAVSHRSAANLHKLAGFGKGPLEVSTHRNLRSDEIIVHSRHRLERRDITRKHRIPVTSVERTLIDLMAVCPVEQVEIALDDALTRRLTTLDHILDRLHDMPPNAKGRRKLMQLIEERKTGGWPNSPLETITNRIFKRFPLPKPSLQYPIYRGTQRIKRVDFAYPNAEVCIEPDGGWHQHMQQRQADARTRNELQAMGWIVIVVTWAEVRDAPRRVYEQIRAALDSRV